MRKVLVSGVSTLLVTGLLVYDLFGCVVGFGSTVVNTTGDLSVSFCN